MDAQNHDIPEFNGHSDSVAPTPDTPEPPEETGRPPIPIDIPISEPTASEPNNNGGYGKPPEANRFKKGQSGNPSGRPAGRRNVRSEFEQALTQSVPVTLHGAQQSPSLVTAIFYKHLRKGPQG